MNLLKQSRLLSFLTILLFVSSFSCSNSPDKHGVTELFHGRPKPVRKVPRYMLGETPTGIFESHLPHSILIMDTGADYNGETGMTYLNALSERYRTSKGKGDIPFHFFIDSEGVVYSGRDVMTPAELHERDPFTLRFSEVSKQDAAKAKLARYSRPKMDLKGYITVVMMGDYDRQLVNEQQEKSLFQLVSNLVFDQNISRDNIFGLRDRFPETKNPGFYLNNYLQPSIVEKNVPEQPNKHRFLIPPQTGLK